MISKELIESRLLAHCNVVDLVDGGWVFDHGREQVGLDRTVHVAEIPCRLPVAVDEDGLVADHGRDSSRERLSQSSGGRVVRDGRVVARRETSLSTLTSVCDSSVRSGGPSRTTSSGRNAPGRGNFLASAPGPPRSPLPRKRRLADKEHWRILLEDPI